MNSLCDKCKELKLEQEDEGNYLTYFQWKSIIKDEIIKGKKKIFKITRKIPITTTITVKLGVL